MQDNRLLEIAAYTINGALDAAVAGADRVELCENPSDGGTTPSYGTLQLARKLLQVPVFVIIRPRGGDFLYNETEFEVMKQDLVLCKKLGFDGVVLGILHADGTIDNSRTSQLVELAYPLDVTFHRAFDRCKEPEKALEDIIDAGCTRILTSGQYPTAIDATGLIRKLVDIAGERIIVMPGSGIRAGNIQKIAEQTGACEFHASARMEIAGKMTFENASMQEKNRYMGVNVDEIVEMKKMLTIVNT